MRYFLLLSLAGLVAAQGMDPWERMKRFDSDGDGKITREEFRGPARMFARFDRDRDGVITKSEVSRRRTDEADTDKDGKVTKEEWSALFDRLDTNGDGVLDASELRRRDRAPKKGSIAPKVKITRRKDNKSVALAPAGKPLVLIFGSWT